MRNYAQAASAFFIAALLCACSGGGSGSSASSSVDPLPQTQQAASLTSAATLPTASASDDVNASHSPPPTDLQSTLRTTASVTWPYTHAPTFAQIPGDFETSQSGWNSVAKYVSNIMTDKRAANYASAAGMRVGFYTDPLKLHGGDVTSYPASAFATTCNGQRIYTHGSGTDAYLGNPSSPSLISTYYNWIRGMKSDQYGSYRYSFALADDSDDPGQTYDLSVFRLNNAAGGIASGLYCGYSSSNFYFAVRGLYGNAPINILFNGNTDPSYYAYMQGLPNVIGGECEGCIASPYLQNGATKTTGDTWKAHMNAGLVDVANRKVFFLSADGAVPDDTIGYTYASYMLMYDQDYTMFRQNGFTASGFGAPPTSLIVPTQPVKATPSVVGNLLWPSGAYGREYNACYIAGKYAGPCAAVVNPDPVNSVGWPFMKREYHHLVQFGGKGIATNFGDNGWINASGPHPGSKVAPAGWAIAFN